MADPPLRLMLDSNVLDRLMAADVEADPTGALHIVDVTGALREAVDAGRITLLVTHIQVDELLDIADDERRRSLIHTLMRIGIREVPTMGWYLGKSRIGHLRIADEETYARIEAFKGGDDRELDDALIAATAVA